MRNEVRLGRHLVASLTDEQRAALSDDPWAAVTNEFGLDVEIVEVSLDQGCGVDGRYDRTRSLVQVTQRASARRMTFTALHELGHHQLRSDRDCVTHLAALLATGRSEVAEEDIADAFAAELLLPASDFEELRKSRPLSARLVLELFEQSRASRSACARRVAESCPGSGYIVIAYGPEILYAAPFGEQLSYRLRAGVVQPEGSPIAEVATRDLWQGTGTLTHRSGAPTPEFNVDAIRRDNYTFAVFTTERFVGGTWTPPTSQRRFKDAPDGPEVICEVCGEITISWERCERCTAFRCGDCGSCPSCHLKKAKPAEKLCPGCFVKRPLSNFPDGSEVCSDQCI